MKRLGRVRLTPYLYLFPGMTAIVLFVYWPVLFNTLLSFTDYNFIRPTVSFVGFSNYTELFTREQFYMALLQSVVYVIGLWPFHVLLPLALALMTLKISRSGFTQFYKVVIFSPTVLSFAIACVIWMWLLDPLGGILAHLLRAFGIESPAWVRQHGYANLAIILVSGWKVFGLNFILFTAALVNIPESLLDAARVDGATSGQIFRRIQWHMITPTTFYVIMTSMMFSITAMLTPIQVMTKGGPFGSTMNIAYFVYTFGFEYFNAGLATAAAVVALLTMGAVVFIMFSLLERKVYYEH